jgi:hypothetical protein
MVTLPISSSTCPSASRNHIRRTCPTAGVTRFTGRGLGGLSNAMLCAYFDSIHTDVLHVTGASIFAKLTTKLDS